MQLQVKESQLYQDLSILLQLIKKKLVLFVNHSSHDQQELTQQKQNSNLLDAFVLKYTNTTIATPQHKVVERFYCRIKELLHQIAQKIPKTKVHLLQAFQHLQELILKPKPQYNNSALIDLINHALNIREIQFSRSQIVMKSTRLKDKFGFLKQQDDLLSMSNITAKRQLNQVEAMRKNALIYETIDIDFEHLRGRYFDLKNNQGSYVEGQMIFRNRFIKQIVSAFQSSYERYKNKELSSEGAKMYCHFNQNSQGPIATSLSAQKSNMEDTQQIILGRSTKVGQQKLFLRRQNKSGFNYKTLDNTINKMTIQTFRSLFEQKINEQSSIKVKNVLMNLHGGQKIKSQFNTKRLQFFKKSQEQVRLRYKYYKYKSTNNSKSSIKYRTINPQSAFSTIDR